MHGIKVLMAKNHIDNLSEETRKGMTEKARAGIYPSFAPVGYRNVDGPAGKRIIEPAPECGTDYRGLVLAFCDGERFRAKVGGRVSDHRCKITRAKDLFKHCPLHTPETVVHRRI